jgi:hypothetical protein
MDISKILTARFGELLLKREHKISTDKTGTRFQLFTIVDIGDKLFPKLFEDHLKEIGYSLQIEHSEDRFNNNDIPRAGRSSLGMCAKRPGWLVQLGQ